MKIRADSGFTLIELMVVVSIVGILAAIATGQFHKFSNKARSAEAKASLTGIFEAEKALYAEASAYTTRFDAMGFKPEGLIYYETGFLNDVAPPVNFLQGSPNCTRSVWVYLPAMNTYHIANCPADYVIDVSEQAGDSNTLTAAAVGSSTNFVAESRSCLVNGTWDDTWQIDDKKNLLHTVDGL